MFCADSRNRFEASPVPINPQTSNRDTKKHELLELLCGQRVASCCASFSLSEEFRGMSQVAHYWNKVFDFGLDCGMTRKRWKSKRFLFLDTRIAVLWRHRSQ